MKPAAPTKDREVEDQVARLTLLNELSRCLSELMDLERLIPEVVERTKQLLEAESSAVLLLDGEKQELYFPYSSDVAPEVERRLAAIRFPADRGIAGWVLREGRSERVNDAGSDPRWYQGVDAESGMGTRSLLCAPLRTRNGTLGVIELRNKLRGGFTEEDRVFLETLAGSVAIAIENARSYGEVKQSEARLRRQVDVLQRDLSRRGASEALVGTSAKMQEVFRFIESAAASPVTVLLQGETGTGKDLIARAIHAAGARKDAPFVAINCGGFSEPLLESELFGHKRGAFTGATRDKPGLFEVADGGTIFLDEIAETTAPMQVRLLRVLQNGEVLPVGGTTPRWVDVRVVSATNRDLEQEVAAGRFREDLYYRLSSFPIRVPPLRERVDDVPPLAIHLLRRTAKKFKGAAANGFGDEVVELLMSYSWPGNVRELENEIARALTLAGDAPVIETRHLSEKIRTQRHARVAVEPGVGPLREARSRFERDYVAQVLEQNEGNVQRTARALGISRVMLYRKLRRYGLIE